MSRDTSKTFTRAVNAAQTSEDFILLFEIDHANLEEPIRVNDSGANVTHDGNVYLPLPFALTLPDDVDGQSPKPRVSVDNIKRDIALAVKQMGSKASTVITIVLSSDSEVIEAQWTDFTLGDFSGDDHTIEGTLTIEDFTTQAYPQHQFTPAFFPGLF